jgi:hypothetical protein
VDFGNFSNRETAKSRNHRILFHAAGASDLLAACWINRFITVAHITLLRTALSFNPRP